MILIPIILKCDDCGATSPAFGTAKHPLASVGPLTYPPGEHMPLIDGIVVIALPHDGEWLVVRTDQTHEEHDGFPSYEEIKKALDGGYLEFVSSRQIKGYGLYVDEEGLLKNLSHNAVATAIAGEAICGPAVILTLADVQHHDIDSADDDDTDANCVNCPHREGCTVNSEPLCDETAGKNEVV